MGIPLLCSQPRCCHNEIWLHIEHTKPENYKWGRNRVIKVKMIILDFLKRNLLKYRIQSQLTLAFQWTNQNAKRISAADNERRKAVLSCVWLDKKKMARFSLTYCSAQLYESKVITKFQDWNLIAYIIKKWFSFYLNSLRCLFVLSAQAPFMELCYGWIFTLPTS